MLHKKARKALWMRHHSARAWMERVLSARRVDEGLDRWENEGGYVLDN